MGVCLPVKQALAQLVTDKDLSEGRLYPSLSTIGEVSFKLAVKVRDRFLTQLVKTAIKLPHEFTTNLPPPDHGVRL